MVKTRILIAEDDPDSSRLINMLLVKGGYEVVKSCNGTEALRILTSAEPPTLAILDWNMPEIDGLEVVRRIREQSVTNLYIYTILLTTRSSKEDILQGLEAGADDYVRKPFDREELLARVRAGERVINLKRQLVSQNKALEEANDRMRNDLQLAVDFQKSLLPSEVPEFKNLRIEWLYEPCDELAGDLLNIYRLDDTHLGLFLLDVSGHGVAASLLTGTLSRLLSPGTTGSVVSGERFPTSRSGYSTPSQVGAHLNNQFRFNENFRQYFTLLYGILDLAKLEFRFIAAGHPSPIHLSGGKATSHNACGLPIGFKEDEKYDEHFIHLKAGDRLFFYSDGVGEIMDSKQALFGSGRVCEAAEQYAGSELRKNMSGILQTAKDWGDEPPNDDISMLALEIVAGKSPAP